MDDNKSTDVATVMRDKENIITYLSPVEKKLVI